MTEQQMCVSHVLCSACSLDTVNDTHKKGNVNTTQIYNLHQTGLGEYTLTYKVSIYKDSKKKITYILESGQQSPLSAYLLVLSASILSKFPSARLQTYNMSVT